MSDQDEIPGEDASKDVKNRMAHRLGGGDMNTENDRNAGNRMNAGRSMNEKSAVPAGNGSGTDDTESDTRERNAESNRNEQNAWNAENVKDAWTGVTVYLPDHIREQLNDEYRRLDYEPAGRRPAARTSGKIGTSNR